MWPAVRTVRSGPVEYVCQELGIDTEPARVEATRSQLNRLAERGWLRKMPDVKFTTAL
jgi:hypothetical protein